VRKNNFNLIASGLSQYYNNSIAIFGDVFLININSSYFDTLEKINTDNSESKLLTYDSIYYNYKLIDLFNSIANIYYVNIYVQPLNKTMIYSRGILNNHIQNNKPTSIINNIIQINYLDMKLFIKITDILPNSHNYVMLMIQHESNNYYLTNILNNDIELLLKNI